MFEYSFHMKQKRLNVKKTIQRDLKGFNAFLLLRKDMHVTNHIILSYSGDESAGTG